MATFNDRPRVLARPIRSVAVVALIASIALPGAVSAAPSAPGVDSISNPQAGPNETWPFHWRSGLFGFPGVNQRSADGLVPVDFGVGADRGLGIIAAGWPREQQFDCETGNLIPGTIKPTTRPALDGFSYDAAINRYRYLWEGEPGFSGTCQQFTLKLTDGSTHRQRFHFRPFAFLPPTQPFDGFNDAVPGQRIAITFRVGPPAPPIDELLVDGFPQSRQADCDDITRVGDLESTDPAGVGEITRSGIRYTYTWQTRRAWSGTCRRFRMLLTDGTLEIVLFRFDNLPVANDDGGASFSTDEDTPFTTPSLLANDSDPDAEPLTVTLLNPGAALGAVTLNPNGTLTYDPGTAFQYLAAGEHIFDPVAYRACDPRGGCDVATALIEVVGLNHPPTDITISGNRVQESRPPNTFIGSLSATDTDASDSHTFSLVAGPGSADNALFKIVGNQLRTKVRLDYDAAAVRHVRVLGDDGHGGTLAKSLTIHVGNVNAAPNAVPQGVRLPEGGSITITLRGRDADDDDLTFAIGGASHGTLSQAHPADCTAAIVCTRTVLYTPAADFNGKDSFNFAVSDGLLNVIRKVSITVDPVNDAPVAANTSFEVEKNGTLEIDLSAFVSDVETADADLTYTIISPPASGDLDGGTYIPDRNFTGPDSFTYQVTDRGDPDGCVAPPCDAALSSAVKTVSIDVEDVNSAPAVSVPEPQSMYRDTMLTFSTNDGNEITVNDLDGNDLTVTVTTTNGTLAFGSTAGLSGIANNAAMIVGRATVDDLNAALDGLTLTSSSAFSGAVTVNVTIDDNGHTGLGGNKTDSDDIVVSVGPDSPPRVFLGGPGVPNHSASVSTGDLSGVAIADSDAVVDDPDPADDTDISAHIVALTANVASPFSNSARDHLVLTATGHTIATDNGLVIDGEDTTAVVVSGSATGSVYQDLLREIHYVNSDTNPGPDTTDRHVKVQVQDGVGAMSSVPTATISLNAGGLNHAPVLDASKSPQFVTVDQGAGAPVGPVGTLVSSLVDLAVPAGQNDNVTDVDGPDVGIAVTAKDRSHGTLYYSIDDGTTWKPVGSVSPSHARLLAADADTRLYYRPNADLDVTVTAAMTFRAWDQTSNFNGAIADTTAPGGGSAFSVATDTVDQPIH